MCSSQGVLGARRKPELAVFLGRELKLLDGNIGSFTFQQPPLSAGPLEIKRCTSTGWAPALSMVNGIVKERAPKMKQSGLGGVSAGCGALTGGAAASGNSRLPVASSRSLTSTAAAVSINMDTTQVNAARRVAFVASRILSAEP